MTIDEAKAVANQLQLIALRLTGTKNEDGTVLIKGIMTEFEELVNRMNPTNVNFFNKMQVEAAQKSLLQIENLMQEQRAEIESLSIKLEQNHLALLERERKAVMENLNTMLKPVYEKIEQELVKHERALIQRVLELESTTNNISLAIKTNYYYFGVAIIVSMVTGIIVGYVL